MTMINWAAVIPSRIIPAGFFNVKVDEAQVKMNTFNGCKQIDLVLKVEMPENPSHGKTHYEFLQLGQVGKVIEPTENTTPEWIERMAIDDPNFDDPVVQANSRELKAFAKMMKSSGYTIEVEQSLEEVVQAAVGRQFTVQFGVGVKETGKRAGEEYNFIGAEDKPAAKVQGIFPFGSRVGDVPTVKSSVPKPQARPTMSAVRPKPMMTAVVSEPAGIFEDEEE